MLLEHERDYGVGMDAKVTVCSLWFGHGCNSNRMLLEHERDYGFIPPQPPRPIPAARICSSTRPLTGAVSKNKSSKSNGYSRGKEES